MDDRIPMFFKKYSFAKTLFQVKFSNKYQTPNKYMEGGIGKKIEGQYTLP